MAQTRIPVNTRGALSQQFSFEAGNEAYLLSEQDCTAIAEANKTLSNAAADRPSMTKNGTAIAARVPAIYRYVKWPEEFRAKTGVHPDHPPRDTKPARRIEIQMAWAEFYKAKLNDPNFRHFRTDGGKRL